MNLRVLIQVIEEMRFVTWYIDFVKYLSTELRPSYGFKYFPATGLSKLRLQRLASLTIFRESFV